MDSFCKAGSELQTQNSVRRVSIGLNTPDSGVGTTLEESLKDRTLRTTRASFPQHQAWKKSYYFIIQLIITDRIVDAITLIIAHFTVWRMPDLLSSLTGNIIFL